MAEIPVKIFDKAWDALSGLGVGKFYGMDASAITRALNVMWRERGEHDAKIAERMKAKQVAEAIRGV